MIRIPKKPKPALKVTTPPKAPMYPAKVWGETCAERLFDLMPRARGELILQDMERWEGAPMQYQWPRYPFPDALTVEAYSGGFWASATASYVPEAGLIDLDPFTLYRLTQTGTVAGAPVTAGVKQAVYNLALYQLMQGPILPSAAIGAAAAKWRFVRAADLEDRIDLAGAANDRFGEAALRLSLVR